jgi:rhodanese-related sulfurtransferase
MNATVASETIRGALALVALSVCLGVTCNGLRRAPVKLLGPIHQCPQPVTALSAQELHVARRGTFLDVRTHAEYLQSHVEEALHVPTAELPERVDSLRAAPAVVVYGEEAERAADLLCRARVSRVFVLHGGLQAWRETGGAVRSGALP